MFCFVVVMFIWLFLIIFYGGVLIMRKRHKMSKRHSRKLFTKTASRVHGRNIHNNPMRGGIRL